MNKTEISLQLTLKSIEANRVDCIGLNLGGRPDHENVIANAQFVADYFNTLIAQIKPDEQ